MTVLTAVAVAIATNILTGAALPLGRVEFELTRADVNGSLVVPQKQVVQLAADGTASAAIWPNALGILGSQYRVCIYDKTGALQLSALATVPNAACNLHDVLALPAPPSLTAIDAGSPSSPLARLQTRRGTAVQWTATNPVLADGEVALETDTRKFKIGDGVSAWAALAYRLLADQTPVTLTTPTRTVSVNGNITTADNGYAIAVTAPGLTLTCDSAAALAGCSVFFYSGRYSLTISGAFVNADGSTSASRALPTGASAMLVSDGTNLHLEVISSQGIFAVANLPAASAALRGARATVSDATQAYSGANTGAAVTGGGANVVPVFCNGAAWVIGG